MNEREREHAPYHERRLEQQQLDALLRIEELLAAMASIPTPEFIPASKEAVELVAEVIEEKKPQQRGKRK
jgi:uncharacterized protein YoaH (UPF0181 family)